MFGLVVVLCVIYCHFINNGAVSFKYVVTRDVELLTRRVFCIGWYLFEIHGVGSFRGSWINCQKKCLSWFFRLIFGWGLRDCKIHF